MYNMPVLFLKEGLPLEFLGILIQFIDTEWVMPVSYGIYHWVCIALTVLACVLVCKYVKKPERDAMRRSFWVIFLVFVFLEAYKQICFTFDYDGETISSEYLWYAFPFQFCSTPMYVSLLAAISKNEKIHDAMCAYLVSFSLFAGLVVLAYPEQCFVKTVGINIQTMVWHCGMIVLGVYLVASGYVKLDQKTVLKAIPVFICFVVCAVILNEVAYVTGLLEDHNFNMFFISPHCDPSLPVYSIVQELLPYPWCLLIYVAGFSAAAYLIVLITMGIKGVVGKKKAMMAV